MFALNAIIPVIGYGSLLSGYGLLAQRRGGKSRLVAREAAPVAIRNARRGLAKPSSHGLYLAMDLEPIDESAAITAQVNPRAADHAVGGLLLEFDREWAAKIATREEYDPAAFMRLLEAADHARKPLGEFLLAIAGDAGFNLDLYRRELRLLLGYTSPGYIFHPVALDDGRVAIVAIGSGYHSSGDEKVMSKRREFDMHKLLSLGEALRLSRPQIDREGQIGYFAECLLGGLHGIAVGDLLAAVELDAEWTGSLARHLGNAARGEHENFLTATSLDERRYLDRFDATPAASIAPLLKLAGLG